jgi:uncharacterized membrane protein
LLGPSYGVVILFLFYDLNVIVGITNLWKMATHFVFLMRGCGLVYNTMRMVDVGRKPRFQEISKELWQN